MDSQLPEAKPELIIYLATTFGLGFIALLHCIRMRPWCKPNLVAPWKIRGVDFGMVILTVFTGLFVIQSIANFIYQDIVPENEHSEAWQTIISGYSNHFIILTLFALSWIFRSDFFPKNINAVSLPYRTILFKAFYGFLLSIPLIYSWGLFMIYLEKIGYSIEKQPLVETIAATHSPLLLLLFIFLAAVIAPISEELIFRGVIYRFIKGHVHPTLALILSALIFSLLHFNTMAYVPLFILGLLLAYSYEVTGNLAVPILLHALFNANTLILIALQAV